MFHYDTLFLLVLFSFFSTSTRLIKCEYILSIELNKFNNPNGLLQDGSKCPAPTCLTYFKFCLLPSQSQHPNDSNNTTTTTSSSQECLSRFETEIIGANVIGEEQFQLTTNSIKFRLNSSWSHSFESEASAANHAQVTDDDDDDTERLFLLIQVLNYEQKQQRNDVRGGGDSATSDRRPSNGDLISEWKLPIRFFKLNKWIRYENSVNFKLSQVFLFDYRLQCADDFYGAKCEIPVCSTGCDLSRGGYCQRPNECICKPGYFGANCDLSIADEMAETSFDLSTQLDRPCPLECQNGGKCIAGQCKCDPRLYKGPQCQIRIVYTCPLTHMCLNGASCLPTGECLCAPGYTGQRCQIKRLNSQCGTVTCYNGGTCFIDNQNEYACICDAAFEGKFCQTKIKNSLSMMVALMSSSSSSPSPLAPIQPPAPIQVESSQPVVYFSTQELLIIGTVGVGMPVLLILLTVILCRLSCAKQQSFIRQLSLTTSKPLKPLKSKIIQAYQQHGVQHQQQKMCKPNIYVSSCHHQMNQGGVYRPPSSIASEQMPDPNGIYASLYEDFVPSGVKNYVLDLESNYMSSIV